MSKFHRKGGFAHLWYFVAQTLPFYAPEFVVVTGDLTDAKDVMQAGGEQYQTEWQQYRQLLDTYGLVEKRNGTFWRDLRGNHDCFAVPDWSHESNYFRHYAVMGKQASWRITDSFPFGNYTFIAIDGWYCLFN